MPSPHWMSIEVFDGMGASAGSWQDAWGDQLVENALISGAIDWTWHRTSWGVIFEVAFENEDAWDTYRASLGVELALAAVPDPVRGVIIYKGRGGETGTRKPRKPRPLIGSGAAELPIPIEAEWLVFKESRRLLVG